MTTQELEKETFEPPTINSWRAAPQPPTQAQIRYATDLCRSELPYAERVTTIATFDVLDVSAMSDLIDRLVTLRETRMKRLRGQRRARRRR